MPAVEQRREQLPTQTVRARRRFAAVLGFWRCSRRRSTSASSPGTCCARRSAGENAMNETPDRHLAWKVAGMSVAMFAFGFFILPPLYDTICEITGFGGRTAPTAAEVTPASEAESNRTVRVEFLASVARGAPWDFEPEVSHL